MNYTFLPESERKNIARDYHIRVAIVGLFFLSLAFLVGVAALFPAYVHAMLEERLHLKDVATLNQTGGAEALSSAENDLSGSAALMSVLSGSIVPAPFSSTVEDIASERGAVEVSSFSLSRAASSTSIVIEGSAPTRAALLAFKDRLVALAPGISVNLPVSELARDTDIQFSIEITE